MCSIFGAIIERTENKKAFIFVKSTMDFIYKQSQERGRDGQGYYIRKAQDSYICKNNEISLAIEMSMDETLIIGNVRAEPTTEFVENKKQSDQQPYRAGNWTIVHNGTIANDKDLRTYHVKTEIDSACIAEILHHCEPSFDQFEHMIRKLKGSYAILAVHEHLPGIIFAACNYRPIFYSVSLHGIFFASSASYFPFAQVAKPMQPYSVGMFDKTGLRRSVSLYAPKEGPTRALVVCSGGLDSVVSASYCKKNLNYDIHLIHFLYDCKAQGKEVNAVRAVADSLNCRYTLFPLSIYDKKDSPLLNNEEISDGESGAEFAHEWVPARNLVMLSIATAFAEANNFDVIILGNNMEEAGAYPDNEPEFINRFNDLLPFAVGAGKQVRVEMPVGNLMKREIVALGHKIDAPMNLTWSCYNKGVLHCGKCGPCYMRRKAFEINNLLEVINYGDEYDQAVSQ